MSRAKTKAVTPRLRFPEFRDAEPWEMKRLGDLGPVSMCKRVMKAQTAPTGDVPFYKIGTFGNEADAYISRDLYKEFKSKYSFPKKGDILISAAGTIGRTVVYDGKPAYFQDSNIVWIANNGELATNEFLNFAYQKVRWRTDDNTISRLYNDNLRSIKVALPSLPEQQKIADCLSSLDELIRAEEAWLEALQAHKKGLMQQLFPVEGETTPRLRFPEFRNAGAWEVKRLGEVGKIATGKTPHTCDRESWHGEIPWITPTDIDDTKRIATSERALTKKGAAAAGLLPKNTVLVTCIASIGKNAILDAPGCCNQQINAIIPENDFDVDFIFYLIEKNRLAMMNLSGGASPAIIPKSEFEKLKLPFPNLPEQQKIADCLSSLDDMIRAQGERIEALKQHKKGLMQQLFPQEVV